MPKSEFPVEIIIRGVASAYSEEEVQDIMKESIIPEIVDALDTSTSRVAFSSKVGERVIGGSDTPSKQDLVLQVAKRLWMADVRANEKHLKRLKILTTEIDDSSGYIFKHAGSVDAVKYLQDITEELKELLVNSFRDLSEDIKNDYMSDARNIVDSTVWHHKFTKEEKNVKTA